MQNKMEYSDRFMSFMYIWGLVLMQSNGIVTYAYQNACRNKIYTNMNE